MLKRARLSAGLLGLALFGTLGCGGGVNQGTGADVTGTVTLDGKPVEVGMVLIQPVNDTSGNLAVNGNLEVDGTFKATSAPIGSVKVVIRTQHMKGMYMAKGGAPGAKGGGPNLPPGKFVDVPAIYQDASKTPFTKEVVKGPNVFTIELKSDAK